MRQALKNLNKPAALETSPLLQLTGVVTNNIGKSRQCTALKQVLLRAVEDHLRPNSKAFDPTIDAWQEYAIVRDYFIAKCPRGEVEAQLNISTAEFYRRADHAIDRLTVFLQEQEDSATANHSQRSASLLISAQPLSVPPRRSSDQVLGRDGVMAEIRRWLANSPGNILALHGIHGVGKTTLAIEIARDAQVQALFPNGVLWARLGYGQPDIWGHLRAWARAMGIAKEDLREIHTTEALSQLIRSRVEHAQVLFLVDDAWSYEDFMPFDVLGPKCAMILTTRFARLALQISPHHLKKIDELDQANSLKMLRSFAPLVFEQHKSAMPAIADRLGGLPIALELAGRRLREASHGQQERRIRQEVQALSGRANNMSMGIRLQPTPQDADRISASLTELIAASVQTLSQEARTLLHQCAVFLPKPATLSEETLTQVTQQSVDVIDELVDRNFLDPVGGNRYTLHQSFFDYARLTFDQTDNGDGLWQALVNYFAQFTTQYQTNYLALEQEYSLTRHALRVAQQRDYHQLFVQMVLDIAPFMQSRGQHAEAVQLLTEAFATAQAYIPPLSGAIAAEACRACLAMDDFDASLRWADVVEQLHSHKPDETSQLAVLEIRAIIAQRRGSMDQAADYAQQAIAAAQQARVAHVIDRQLLMVRDVQQGYANGLHLPDLADTRIIALQKWQQGTIAYVYEGNLEKAHGLLREALPLAKAAGDKTCALNIYAMLSVTCYALGNYAEAVADSEDAEHYGMEELSSRALGFVSTCGGLSRFHLGDATGAFAQLQDGFNRSHKLYSAANLSWICFALSSYYLEMKQAKTAYEVALSGISFAQQSRAHDAFASPLGACGRACVALNRLNDAHTYFKESHDRSFDPWTRTVAEADLGLLYKLQGDLDKAEATLRAAYDFFMARKARRYALTTGFGLANLLQEMGQHEGAIAVAGTCARLSEQTGDTRHKLIRRWADRFQRIAK